MTTKSLPIKLKKEPIVDAIFEIRFSSSIPASSVLPGLVFSMIKSNEKTIERLPVSDIPMQMRELDQNLRFQPLLRIKWDGFLILIGDESLSVACNMPYPGWDSFRKKIIDVVNILKDSSVINNINRYSVKYVDIIAGKDIEEQISMVNLSLDIGGHRLLSEAFNVRVEIIDDLYIHVVQIAAPANVTLIDGETRDGVLVAVDSISKPIVMIPSAFSDLINSLDVIHDRNKDKFFGCLKSETITYLEPVYE